MRLATSTSFSSVFKKRSKQEVILDSLLDCLNYSFVFSIGLTFIHIEALIRDRQTSITFCIDVVWQYYHTRSPFMM